MEVMLELKHNTLVENYLDDYNKFEAYAQELRLESDSYFDVVIYISRKALATGKRRFLRMLCASKKLNMALKMGLRQLVGLDG
ncbi:hypothetical protein H5410_051622 [Solanum commersonii]|uniref:Uncharacterized protein n=1 Tax=Solanum commersonii TaxID=4109 RepID=A0A9J5WYY2_SOLCO|nr:hypothetical protein H5410_051622 [Solanum commersonii]